MPAKSKAQRRYFGMIAAGVIKRPRGMSRTVVDEFAHTPEKGLPERVRTGGGGGGRGGGRGQGQRQGRAGKGKG